MSETTAAPVPGTLQADLEQELQRYSALPTIKGKDAAVAFLTSLGIPVRRFAITSATADRSLESFLISGACVYSERSVVRWALSRSRGRTVGA
jgi:hypothetical protein